MKFPGIFGKLRCTNDEAPTPTAMGWVTNRDLGHFCSVSFRLDWLICFELCDRIARIFLTQHTKTKIKPFAQTAKIGPTLSADRFETGTPLSFTVGWQKRTDMGCSCKRGFKKCMNMPSGKQIHHFLKNLRYFQAYPFQKATKCL
jgi:hypothetical protein